MKIMYGLPVSHRDHVRRLWEEVKEEFGISYLPETLQLAFKMCFRELLNDSLRVALFDGPVAVHVNNALIEAHVAATVENMDEDACIDLLTDARNYVHIAEEAFPTHILVIMSEVAREGEDEDDPANYLEPWTTMVEMIVTSFSYVLTAIVPRLDPEHTVAEEIGVDRLKRAVQLVTGDTSNVTVSQDYGFIVIEAD